MPTKVAFSFFGLLAGFTLCPMPQAQARLEWPAMQAGGQRTERFVKLGKAAGKGRDMKGRIRRWRLGDMQKSWLGEDRITLKFQGRTLRTKVREEVDHLRVHWPWQPAKHHNLFTRWQEWDVRMDTVVINNIPTGQLPVEGRFISFGDTLKLKKGREADFSYGQGTLRLTPPGRNKLSFSVTQFGYTAPLGRHWRWRAALERGQSQVIGTQWKLSAEARYTPPKAKWAYVSAGGEAFSSGLPVYDATLGGPSSLLAFVYKFDKSRGVASNVAPLYEKATGVLWLELGAEAKF